MNPDLSIKHGIFFSEPFLPFPATCRRLSGSKSLLQDWWLAIDPSVVSPGTAARVQTQGIDGPTFVAGQFVVLNLNHKRWRVGFFQIFSYHTSIQFHACYHLTEADSELLVRWWLRPKYQNTMVDSDVPFFKNYDMLILAWNPIHSYNNNDRSRWWFRLCSPSPSGRNTLSWLLVICCIIALLVHDYPPSIWANQVAAIHKTSD